MIAESLLCWNCRGAKSGDFLRELKEFQKVYKPVIIVLIELKISGIEAHTVCRRIGKSHWFRSEATGFSGGIWLLWNDNDISVSLRYAHKLFLHAAVVSAGGKAWDLIAVYASPNPRMR